MGGLLWFEGKEYGHLGLGRKRRKTHKKKTANHNTKRIEVNVENKGKIRVKMECNKILYHLQLLVNVVCALTFQTPEHMRSIHSHLASQL